MDIVVIILLILLAINIPFIVIDRTLWINWAAIVICFIALIYHFIIEY